MANNRKYGPEVIKECYDLIQEKVPHKVIMESLKVSEDLLCEISTGRILPNGDRVKGSWGGMNRECIDLKDRKYELCPECRNRVQMPCLKCCIDKGDMKSLTKLMLTPMEEKDRTEPKRKYNDNTTYSPIFKKLTSKKEKSLIRSNNV